MDVNARRRPQFFNIGAQSKPSNHKLLAYSTDTAGPTSLTLHVKDLETGALLLSVSQHRGVGAWATKLHAVLHHARQRVTYRLYRHTLGTDAAADVLIYEETDERLSVELSKTRSKQYLLMTLESPHHRSSLLNAR